MCSVIIRLLYIIAASSVTDARLTTKPSHAIAFVGDRVTMSCATDLPNNKSVMWQWLPSDVSKSHVTLFHERPMGRANGCQFDVKNEIERTGDGAVEHSQSTRIDLIIDSVDATKAGRYVCRDDGGRSRTEFATADLVVAVDRSPICDKRNDGDTDFVSIVCRFRYAGRTSPTDAWINVDANSSVNCKNDVHSKNQDADDIRQIENCVAVRRPTDVSQQYNYTVMFFFDSLKPLSPAIASRINDREVDIKVTAFATSVTIDPRKGEPANCSNSGNCSDNENPKHVPHTTSIRSTPNHDDNSSRSLVTKLVIIVSLSVPATLTTTLLMVWFCRRRKNRDTFPAGLSVGTYQDLLRVERDLKHNPSHSVVSPVTGFPDPFYEGLESRTVSDTGVYDEVYDSINEHYEIIDDN